MTESRTLQKIKDMIAYGNTALLHFPKIERGGMVMEIKQSMYRLLRLCIQCDQKYYKKNTLQEMNTEKEYIQSLVGIAANKDHRYITMKKYEIWSNYLVEIGKMLGARMRAESKKA